jgi:hypothetical protein
MKECAQGGCRKPLRPEFAFLHGKADGSTGDGILYSHGHQFGEPVSKLRGLVDRAEEYGIQYWRIEEINGTLYVLDMQKPSARVVTRKATTHSAAPSAYLRAGEPF